MHLDPFQALWWFGIFWYGALALLAAVGVVIMAVALVLLRDPESRPSQSAAGRAEPARGLSRSRMVRWFARNGDQGVVRGGNK